MIWIRADANREIGTGHVMRCLSVAMALRERNQDVVFLLADESAVALLEARGQKYMILHTSYEQMETELPILQKLGEEYQPDLCLVDSYYVTPGYLEALGKLCKTAYMDDVFSFAYPVDMVINYNIYGDLFPYRETSGIQGTEFLLGTSYAPLRKEFRREETISVRKNAESVLITTGGSDKYNLAGQILQAVLQDETAKRLHYHVVSGVFNQNLPALLELEREYPQITIHKNVSNMVALMQKCDIAVTAGGSTMYELCAVGIPIICFSFVDNQQNIVKTFSEKELVCYGGDYLQEGEMLVKNVVKHVNKLAYDTDARVGYSRKAQELVDGRGAERIAQALIKKTRV
uniref:UDP-2,4-diacetamido-2,4, 6-trideoxy-beta-L-altropyranose hydrolase n=1 Tax=Acetatifactor sp. TaxID=1872090 RepID=UPI00405795F8